MKRFLIFFDLNVDIIRVCAKILLPITPNGRFVHARTWL